MDDYRTKLMDLADAEKTIAALVAALVGARSAIVCGCDTLSAVHDIDAALALADPIEQREA